MTEPRLTTAQRDTLAVLGEANKVGATCYTTRRSSRLTGWAVNARAAESLRQLGLAHITTGVEHDLVHLTRAGRDYLNAVWQPDPKTIEWLAKQLEWELDRQDTRGPAAYAGDIPVWMRRVAKDGKRLREAR